MVNIIIYLKKEFNAEELVGFLLFEKLIASATVDENNISYKIHNDNIYTEIYSVITAQSKSLLLKNIIETVENRIKDKVLINSTPIVGSSQTFDELIKEKTIKI